MFHLFLDVFIVVVFFHVEIHKVEFGIQNVGNLYRAGSLKRVASKMAKHNSDLVAVQKVGHADGGSQPADDYKYFLWQWES
jgi:hypothetical protein